MYIDETSQTAHRYLALGGIILHAPAHREIEGLLTRARLPELPNGEMAWTKVSRTKLPAYIRFVDLFFDNTGGFAPFDFYSLVVDTHRINDNVHNGGSRENGFNKEIFQLCQKFARIHDERLLHIYLDRRETKSPTEDLRFILNRWRNNRGETRDWPFRRVHFRDSCDWQMLQLVDVLLGAVAFRLNGHDRKPNASPAKTALSNHVLGRAGVRDVSRDTAMSGKFTIWHRQLK
ncbi:MAG: DUF3800 domain-containing protein [Devosia sp.]|nr:DUF3800 domain-containing protein [Devosia sp.]